VAGIAGLDRRYVRGWVLALGSQLAGTVVTHGACNRRLRVIKPKCRFPACRKFVVAELALRTRCQSNVMFSGDAAGFYPVMASDATANNS
jgi:hypothetical protein